MTIDCPLVSRVLRRLFFRIGVVKGLIQTQPEDGSEPRSDSDSDSVRAEGEHDEVTNEELEGSAEDD